MSNNNSGPTGPSDPNPPANVGATGGTVTISPNTATSNGGTISINGGVGFPGQWITAAVPMGGWGYVSMIPSEPAAPAPKKKDDRDGCDCKKCKDFYPYAEPNQEDGTLICYRCRHGW